MYGMYCLYSGIYPGSSHHTALSFESLLSSSAFLCDNSGQLRSLYHIHFTMRRLPVSTSNPPLNAPLCVLQRPANFMSIRADTTVHGLRNCASKCGTTVCTSVCIYIYFGKHHPEMKHPCKIFRSFPRATGIVHPVSIAAFFCSTPNLCE